MKLKPCLFCEGSDALAHELNGPGLNWVRCLCGATGSDADSEKEAADEWNTRVRPGWSSDPHENARKILSYRIGGKGSSRWVPRRFSLGLDNFADIVLGEEWEYSIEDGNMHIGIPIPRHIFWAAVIAHIEHEERLG